VPLPPQLAVGANLLVSMGTMFAVGYYAGGTDEAPHGPRATMCGLASCIGTMLVEMTLFLIGASRIDAKQVLYIYVDTYVYVYVYVYIYIYIYIYIYTYIYIYICVCVCVYIYIYIERERER